jgi:hypothetical protein
MLSSNFYVEPVFEHLTREKNEVHSASGYGAPNKISHPTLYAVSVKLSRPWQLASVSSAQVYEL